MKLKCPHCNNEFEVDKTELAKAFASLGGQTTAKRLTKQQRIAKAKMAIQVRWKKVQAQKK